MYSGKGGASCTLDLSLYGVGMSMCMKLLDVSAHVLVSPRVKVVTYMIVNLGVKKGYMIPSTALLFSLL